MKTLSDTAVRMLEDLRARQDEIVDFIVQLAEIETPTEVPAAQAPAQALLRGALEELGLDVRHLPGEACGGHLLAQRPDMGDDAPRQLLLGHSDTVWPLGTLASMPVERRDGVLAGPGVLDMKTGLAQIVFALDALRRHQLVPSLHPVVFISTDEEVGSRESMPHVRDLAARAQRVFVVEPAFGPEGRLKTGRKGTAHYTITVEGRAAHAGLAPESGVSAIHEMARVVEALHAINDPAHGISVNVGTINGGTARNVVPASCRVIVEARVVEPDQVEPVEAAIRGIAPTLSGAAVHVDGGFVRPPMKQTPRDLWSEVQTAADELGLDIDEATVGGASDGNNTSQLSPTLDGLGGVGAGAHAHDEHVVIARIPERTALLARLMMV